MQVLRGVKRSFWRGVAALLPALLTVIVLALGITSVHNYVGLYVNIAIQYVVHWASGIPLADVEAWYDRYWLGWLGVVAAVIGLCVVAYFVGTFLGTRIVRFFETSIMRMPILRRIYPGAKQVSEFFFAERQVEFRRVVAIEYPRRGLWSVGFVTGRSLRAITEQTEEELLTVFIPNSPMPVTGYIVAVPRREVIDLPISVDEAFQFTISGGVIVPPAERLESLEVALLVNKTDQQEAARELKEQADTDTTPDDTDSTPNDTDDEPVNEIEPNEPG
ncbi:MAG TPA: DUF502 domain-containing protein [Phycisphaerae bacterium]|nr:DUF502 domain-containing protein [Phycisphaerae bacterium]